MVEVVQGCRFQLSGMIFKMSDHLDLGIDQWDLDDGPHLLRVEFSARRDPIGNAKIIEYPNGDLWCDADVVTDAVDFTRGAAFAAMRVCDAWSVGCSVRGEHRRTGFCLVPSLVQVPALRTGSLPHSPPILEWRLKARVPRVLLSELMVPEVVPHLAFTPETFEVGLSVHGDLVPLGPGVVPLHDETAIELVRRRRRER